MIFRLPYENCGLNPAKPDFFRPADFFSAGCGLAKLRLASRLKYAAYKSRLDSDQKHADLRGLG